MPIFSGEWSGIPNALITIALGLILVTITAIVSYRIYRGACKYIMIGLTIGLYMMVNFTSAKNCALIIGGKEYFIIAGSLMYPVLAYALDIIIEFWGEKDAKISVHAQLVARILVTVYLIWILYLPSPSGENANYVAFRDLMQVLPRVTAASIVANYICSLLNIYVFMKIYKATKEKKLWARSSISSFLSLTTNVALFSFLSFIGTRPIVQIFQMIVFSMVVRFVMSVLEIPFMYFLKWLQNKEMFAVSKEV